MTFRTETLGPLVQRPSTWSPQRSAGSSEFRYIDLSSVDRDEKRIVGASTIQAQSAPSRARQLVQTGDVLVSTVRPNLNGVAEVPPELDGATASTGFTVLRAKTHRLDGRYLFHWVRSPAFVRDMTKKATGASYPAVTDKIVLGSKIPLPSLEEQRRIAAVLDKADAIRRKRREAIELTEELLRSTFLVMFGDPVTNPKGWGLRPLSDVVLEVKSGWSAKGEDRRYSAGERGVLKVSAVTSGWYEPDEHKAVPDNAISRSLVVPKKGDLLFSRANTRHLVAAACIVETEDPGVFLPDKLWRITTDGSHLRSEVLLYVLKHERFRNQLRGKATGTSGSMLNISKKKLLEEDIPVPPMATQDRFADVFWSSLETRRKLQLVARDADRLFHSLVQRAFRGDL